MNQSKFSLADLITLLAALAFGFVCFLGANFYTLGKTRQSIILAVIISLLLGGLALGAKWLKRTNGNFKTCFIWEMILLVLFTGLTVFFTYSPFSHYFVVSVQKEVIQREFNASITQTENMFTEYENYAHTREGLYKGKLESVVNNKNVDPPNYTAFDFKNTGGSDSIQIRNKMKMMDNDLFPSNFEDIKIANSNWLAKLRSIVNNWKPISVVVELNSIEQNSNQWLDQLVQLSTIREKKEKAIDFDYRLHTSNIKSYFTTLGKPTPISIGLAIVLYLLMLLSYLISKRSTKNTIGTNKNNGDFDIEY
jgi:hypothetical protein